MVMPGISGAELAERLSARVPGLRVLPVSGHTPETLASKRRPDAPAILEKPFTSERLLARVRAARLTQPGGGVRIIWVQVKKAAFRSSFSIRTSQTCVRRPTCRGRPMPVRTSPGAPGREHVRLQLGGREVAALGQVAEGAPGGHRVGERDPDAAVHVAARV